MNAELIAAFYALLAITFPLVAFRHLADTPLLIRVGATWGANALILFLLSDFLMICVVSAALMALLAPGNPKQRLYYFLAVFASMPIYITAFLPFPGINWLVFMNYVKISAAICLFPMLLYQPARSNKVDSWSAADICLVLYIVYTSITITFGLGLTGGLRFILDQMLLFALPYFIINRVVRNVDDLDHMVEAVFIAALILATAAALATVKHWDFYRFKEPPSVFTIPDTRAGLIRIATTANTHSLGYFCSFALIAFEYLKSRLSMSLVHRAGLRIILLGGLYVTNSRGALLSLLLAAGITFYFRIKASTLRGALFVATAIAVPIGTSFLLSGDASNLDPYGTIAYRHLLLTTSLQHIADYPIFGDLNYMSDARFLPLLQGQGIIDITNYYLQIMLSYGILGLALLLGFFVPSLLTLMRRAVHKNTESDVQERIRSASTFVLAVSVGWLGLVATTSDAGFTLQLGVICAGLARAATRLES